MEDQPAVKRTFDLRLTDGHVEYILTQAEKFRLCIWKDGGCHMKIILSLEYSNR